MPSRSNRLIVRSAPREREAVTNFYVAIEEIEKRYGHVGPDSFQYAAADIGGGKVHSSATVDPSVVVGIDSTVGPHSQIQAGTKLLGVRSTEPAKFVFGKDVLLGNVEIDGLLSLTIGENTSISDSELRPVTGSTMTIAASQTMTKGLLGGDSLNYYPKSVHPQRMRLVYAKAIPATWAGIIYPGGSNTLNYQSVQSNGSIVLSGQIYWDQYGAGTIYATREAM